MGPWLVDELSKLLGLSASEVDRLALMLPLKALRRVRSRRPSAPTSQLKSLVDRVSDRLFATEASNPTAWRRKLDWARTSAALVQSISDLRSCSLALMLS